MIFDWIFYINRYPELYNLGIDTREKAIKHWCYNGIKEGKKINNNQININIDNYNPDELYNQLTNNTIEHFNNIKFKILTSKLIESIALNLQKILTKFNINSEIIYSLTSKDKNNNDYYIIIYNSFDEPFLPKKYILYVVEQSTSTFFKNYKYLDMIKKANFIWDFCVKNKKMFQYYPYSKYFYLSCPFITGVNNINSDIKYDLYFYGAINSRRSAIIDKLKTKYNIFYSDKTTGIDRDNIIKESKIILNLHYYDDAGLETCRINEILKYNKLVISESTNDDFYNMELYKNSVVFIDIIDEKLYNIQNLYNTIDKYLQNTNEYNNKLNSIISNNNILQNKSEFNIQKILLSIENTNINYKMNYYLIPNKIYCLHLVETPNRIKIFNKQKYKPEVEIFPAIKYEPGWIGCALSYVNIIYNAKRLNINKITICEDDCRFTNNFDLIYNNINEVLNKINSWDIFVGCIADLPSDTIFNNVYKYKDMTFIEINKMHSTVFNIYNKSSYDTIIKWDLNNKNNKTNTIDKYIQNQNLKIITTYPFYFDCLNVDSTLWNSNLYESYNIMFQKSLTLIKTKLNSWTKPIITLG